MNYSEDSFNNDPIVENLSDSIDSSFDDIEKLRTPRDGISELSVEDRISLASNDPLLTCYLENCKGVSKETPKSVIFSEHQIESINQFTEEQIYGLVCLQYGINERDLDMAILQYQKDYLDITKD